jgi:hypothetical protein
MAIARSLAIPILLLLVCAPAVGQNTDAQPASSPAAPLYSESGPPVAEHQAKITPDNNPLTGALKWTLGSSESSHNLVTIGFRVSEIVDTNPTINSTQTSVDLQSASLVGGNFLLQRQSPQHEISARYDGGAGFYTNASQLNSSFHSFGVSNKFFVRRWTFLLSDDVSYANQSDAGGMSTLGGLAGFSSPSGLQSTYAPNQTILTQRTGRLNNSAAAQVEYHLGPRVSVTAGGSYGLLHFLDPGLTDNNQLGGSLGLNYSPNSHDSVGIAYDYMRFRYSDSTYKADTHTLRLLYGRRLTGRLSLQLGAGPQIVSYGSGLMTHQLGWNVSSNLAAMFGRTNANFGYSHSVTGGAGVLPGASTDAVQLSLSRNVTRMWTTSVQFGYARNSALNGSSIYNYGTAGINLTRSVGRRGNISVFYNAQRQTSAQVAPLPQVGCNTADCALLRHVVGMAFQWNLRPIRIE